MMTCFYSHQPNLNITGAPLQAAVAKKIRFPIPQLPVKGYGVFLGGTGCQHFSCSTSTPSPQFHVAEAKFQEK